MDRLAGVKSGDVFAVVDHRSGSCPRVTKVTIDKVSKTVAIDAKGGRWSIRKGRPVGASAWDWKHLRPWTAEHDALVADSVVEWRYEEAMDALGASGVYKKALADLEKLRAALPHLEAAVKAKNEA